MKIHNSFIHVVLSLVLLVSQQLGLSHMMMHMDSSLSSANATGRAATGFAVGGNDDLKLGNTSAPMLSDSLADSLPNLLADSLPKLFGNPFSDALSDASCEQCLTFSQLATALPVVDSPAPPILPASFIAGVHEDHSICSQTQCVYLSRAPPVLA